MIRRQGVLLYVLLACSMTGPADAATVLVTGANSGLGLEFTKRYAALGWDVIATHRRSSIPDSLAAVIAEHDNVRVERMDVTDAEQIAALAAKLAGVPIDVLINNAGIYSDRSGCTTENCIGEYGNQSFGNLSYTLFDTIMSVNVAGVLRVSEAFVEHVKASEQKKIIAIGSTNGSVSEPLGGSGAIFYRSSKAALNRAMQLVALALKPEGITVVILHPGAVLTERQAHLAEFPIMIEMDESVGGMIDVIEGVTLDDAGRFIQYDGKTAPW